MKCLLVVMLLCSVNLVQGQSIEHVREADPAHISAPRLPDAIHLTTNICPPPPKDIPVEQFATAANRWMRVPVDIAKQRDSATPSDRYARDKYWDGLIPASFRLSDPCSRPKPLPIAGFFPEELSQEELQEGAWLVGTFEDYSTHISSTELSIYTEIEFRVSRVLGKPKMPHLKSESVISIDCGGGTITAPGGKEISFRVYPKKYFFQPSHTYLLHLSYVENGSFFVFNEGLGRRWDVVDGIAKPDSGMEVSKSQHGISDLPLEEAVEILARRIEQSDRKERQ